MQIPVESAILVKQQALYYLLDLYIYIIICEHCFIDIGSVSVSHVYFHEILLVLVVQGSHDKTDFLGPKIR